MGNKNSQGRLSARRAATFLAALGVLVISSGAALMVTATPANAKAGPAPKVTFCHATSSETNPYVLITTSANAFYQGHVVKNHEDDVYPAVTFTHGQQTISVLAHGDQSILENGCQQPGSEPEEPALDATAAVDVTNPSCDNDNTPDYEISGSHVTWQVVEEDLTPGGHVKVDFTATPNHAFSDESDHTSITKYFGDAQEGCTEVSAPITPSVTFTEPTCASPSAAFAGTNTDKVEYKPTSGTVAPGADVVITATAKGDNKLTGQTTFPHKFAAVPTNCTVVAPPQVQSSVVVSPPKAKTPKAKAHASAATVTPTVVEAGLSTSAPDLRGEQGLALMFAGMVMLLAAGGLGLRVRGVAARI
jgi:hypothetical protein